MPMPTLQDLWNSTIGRYQTEDFQPSQGNKRRVEIYDALIYKAQERADQAQTVAARRDAIKLIARLDARCMREVQRREDQARP